MLIGEFNRAWESERDIIAAQLRERLQHEIESLEASMNSVRGHYADDDKLEFMKMRNQLVLRKALAVYEAEDITRNRMQLRASYIALFMSSLALMISVVTVLIKL